MSQIARVQEALSSGLRRVEEELDARRAVLAVLAEGFQAYKADLVQPSDRLFLEMLWQRIREDSELGLPHRKILDCLSQLDSDGGFPDVQFSKLVRAAHVGKNSARAYLDLLIKKGYLVRRDDGYRHFYRLRREVLAENLKPGRCLQGQR